MPFEKIRFQNFRNLLDAEIPVHSGQVFFIGENGQGKSNFLEAIYCLCYGKSFRCATDNPMIKHECADMGISGDFIGQTEKSNIKITIQNGKKVILNDGETIVDRKNLIDRYPCIVFCHEDLDFVRGGPEFQRQFFDQTASLLLPSYLGDLRDYGKVLKTRNLLIKEQNVELLPPYNQKLIEIGMRIQLCRQEIIDQFNELFSPIFADVSQSSQKVAIQYLPNWQGLDKEKIEQRLKDRLPRDLALKTTTSGPHRDKFLFTNNDTDYSLSASTGQFRLMSLLLRLAQASLLHSKLDRKPILLLDDVLLELDFAKRKRFLNQLPPADQQFFTFLPDEQVQDYRAIDSRTFQVKAGVFHEKN